MVLDESGCAGVPAAMIALERGGACHVCLSFRRVIASFSFGALFNGCLELGGDVFARATRQCVARWRMRGRWGSSSRGPMRRRALRGRGRCRCSSSPPVAAGSVRGFVDARAVGGEPVGDGAEGGLFGVAGDSGFFN